MGLLDGFFGGKRKPVDMLATASAAPPPSVGTLFATLIESAPQKYGAIHLLAEARNVGGKISVLFTHGYPIASERAEEYTIQVADQISTAAFVVMQAFLQQYGEQFPGFEVLLERTNKWNARFRILGQGTSNWPSLPRCPLKVIGHGFCLAPAPNAIFRWSRSEDSKGILASTRRDLQPTSTVKRAQLSWVTGEPQLKMEGASNAGEVLQFSEGPLAESWTIETPVFFLDWPAHFDLRSPLASRTRFDLLDDRDSLIFVQGPLAASAVSLEALGAEDQTEVERGQTRAGHRWVEFSYSAEGEMWRQRHCIRLANPDSCFVVTSQGREANRAKVFVAAETVADSLSTL